MEHMENSFNKSTVVSISGLKIYRGGRPVIDDFSLDLAQGDFVAIIGANGSGKTTILRAITGFIPFQTGQITLFQERSSDLCELRKRIGYVPQNIPIDYRMPLSVKDVVAMGRFGRTGPGRRLTKNDYNLVMAALSDTGIARLADRPIGHLSGGEIQKAHIARAICQQPELLLLDEPTSNLDLGAQQDCLELIAGIHTKYRLTTMIVMHDLASLPAACNRAVIIDNAKTVFNGPFSEAFSETNLKHVYKNRIPSSLSRHTMTRTH